MGAAVTPGALAQAFRKLAEDMEAVELAATLQAQEQAQAAPQPANDAGSAQPAQPETPAPLAVPGPA